MERSEPAGHERCGHAPCLTAETVGLPIGLAQRDSEARARAVLLEVRLGEHEISDLAGEDGQQVRGGPPFGEEPIDRLGALRRRRTEQLAERLVEAGGLVAGDCRAHLADREWFPGRKRDQLVELRVDAPEVRTGDPNQVVDGACRKPETMFGDLPLDPGAQLATFHCRVERHRPASLFHSRKHGVAIRDLGMHREAEHRGRRQLAKDLHEPLGRVGAAAFGRPRQLGRVAEQERSLGIEERHLGDRMAEFGEPPGAFEHLDVELRRARTIAPRLDRSIHQEAILAVDERQLIQRRTGGHRRSIASGVTCSPRGRRVRPHS